MKKKYVKRDVDQQINSRQFLKTFKFKARDDKNDLRAYNRQFRSVIMSLIKIEQLDNYIMTLWYIQELLKFVASKMIRKHEIDLLDALSGAMQWLVVTTPSNYIARRRQ